MRGLRKKLRAFLCIKHKNDIQMETKEKCIYESPVVSVLDVQPEGLTCISGTREGYGEAIEDEWE